MFPHIGLSEILVIAVVAALLFGRNKLPEAGKSLGRAIHNFKRSLDEPDEIDVTPRKEDKADKPDGKKNGTDS